MYGYTDELTPTVSVAAFSAAVEQRSWQTAARQIGVAESTIYRWINGVGIPEPRYWTKIERFVRYYTYSEAALEYAR